MITTSKLKVRHPRETAMLMRALGGNEEAANNILKLLSSANPILRKIMQEAVYDLPDPQIWFNLLCCLALQRWDKHLDCERRADPVASQRIDQSITEVFLRDETKEDQRMKEAALLTSLEDPTPKVRHASAYLLGLRGDPRAIPMLTESIETGSNDWQLRAIHALAELQDERCGPPLLKALINNRGKVHREAGRALNRLGRVVESTLIGALDHPDKHIRWHAARGLGNIGDASLAHMLAEGLLDENQAVRWASGDVLANLGKPAVPATLKILTQYKLDTPTRRAVYHALHGITSREVQARLKPLLEALRGSAASVEAPLIAQRLLLEWERTE